MDERMRGLDLGFINPVGTWSVLDFRPGSGGVEWCYVCLRGESGFFVKRAGTGICILFLADTCAF